MIEYRVIWWERFAGVAEPVSFSGCVWDDWECAAAQLSYQRHLPHVTKAFIEARPASDAPWPRFWDEDTEAWPNGHPIRNRPVLEQHE